MRIHSYLGDVGEGGATWDKKDSKSEVSIYDRFKSLVTLTYLNYSMVLLPYGYLFTYDMRREARPKNNKTDALNMVPKPKAPLLWYVEGDAPPRLLH